MYQNKVRKTLKEEKRGEENERKRTMKSTREVRKGHTRQHHVELKLSNWPTLNNKKTPSTPKKHEDHE